MVDVELAKALEGLRKQVAGVEGKLEDKESSAAANAELRKTLEGMQKQMAGVQEKLVEMQRVKDEGPPGREVAARIAATLARRGVGACKDLFCRLDGASEGRLSTEQLRLLALTFEPGLPDAAVDAFVEQVGGARGWVDMPAFCRAVGNAGEGALVAVDVGSLLERIATALSRRSGNALHDLFHTLDSQGRGRLVRADLTRLARSFEPTCAECDVDAFCSAFGSDGRGGVPLAEFRAVLLRAAVGEKSPSPAAARRAGGYNQVDRSLSLSRPPSPKNRKAERLLPPISPKARGLHEELGRLTWDSSALDDVCSRIAADFSPAGRDWLALPKVEPLAKRLFEAFGQPYNSDAVLALWRAQKDPSTGFVHRDGLALFVRSLLLQIAP